jgi:lipopolysaccharide transport system permease protein
LVRLGRLLFLRDFRYRYRQAFLKYAWAVARPLMGVLPLILVGNAFGLGGDMSASEYALFALSGFLMWQMFWDAVISPQWIARRLRRTFVDGPLRPEAVVAAGAGLVIFNSMFYGGLFAVAYALTRTVPPSTLPLGLLALPVIVIGGLTIGAFFVPLTFVYLDFRFGLPLLAPLLLWTAPIIYTAPEAGLLAVVNRWNPLTYLINIPRGWLVIGAGDNDPLFLVCAIVFAGLAFCILRFFRRAMPLAVQSLPQR